MRVTRVRHSPVVAGQLQSQAGKSFSGLGSKSTGSMARYGMDVAELETEISMTLFIAQGLMVHS